MTVVLGLRCADGLVLATDSQATAMMPGGTPVRMDTPKIDQVGDALLFAGTGAQGVGQRVKQALENNLNKIGKSKAQSKIGPEIHRLVNPLQKASEAAYVNVPGSNMEVWGGIFCGISSDGFYLMEIDLNGGWQFYDNLPFAATGSGHAFVHLAVSSVLHHDVANQTLAAAKLLAFRAIENVCLASAFGVGLPVQLATVTEDGISVLEEDDIKELEETVNLWKKREVEVLGELAPKPANGEAVVEEDEGLEPPAS